MRSVCVLPLTSPLRRLGGLSFASREANAFGEADVEFLRELTSQVALAVDNALHHEAAERAQRELARERDRLQLLLEVNNALVSNLEPRALFGAISARLRRVVAHDYTSLAVYDAEQQGVRHVGDRVRRQGAHPGAHVGARRGIARRDRVRGQAGRRASSAPTSRR